MADNMTRTVLNIGEIVSDPKVRSGRPVIAGTGIMVSDIVLRRTTGDRLSAEEIADHYRLNLGQVHAALAYYYLHQQAIDDEIQQSADEAERLIEETRQQGRLLRPGSVGG